jgi:hypothetical protein
MTLVPGLWRFALALLALPYFSVAPVIAQSEAPQSQGQPPAPAQKSGSSTTKLVGQPAPELPTEAQEPTLTIRQTVRRVIVDVMVRDSDGKPVHGLTANDFSITEDKDPQHILSFDVYDFDKASISRAPNAPPLPPNVFENIPKVPERGPLYVMLLDLVNTEMADQMMARQQVLKFIKSKPAGTRFLPLTSCTWPKGSPRTKTCYTPRWTQSIPKATCQESLCWLGTMATAIRTPRRIC